MGASFPARSEVDKYLIAELTSLGKKGALISDESALGLAGKVGAIASGTRAKDTDNDGIPDAWEDANGLDKSDATDAVKKSASGYLNIELYINGLVGPPPVGIAGPRSGSGITYDPASGILASPREGRATLAIRALDGRLLWSTIRDVSSGETILPVAQARLPRGIHRLELRLDGEPVLSRSIAILR